MDFVPFGPYCHLLDSGVFLLASYSHFASPLSKPEWAEYCSSSRGGFLPKGVATQKQDLTPGAQVVQDARTRLQWPGHQLLLVINPFCVHPG